MDEWAYRILFFPTLAFLFISTLYRLIADKIQHEKKQKEIGTGVDDPFIKINLTVENNKLEFDVKNKYAGEMLESKDGNSGIGLENVKSRLMLLYPKQHSLIVKKDADIFGVHLTLQLK